MKDRERVGGSGREEQHRERMSFFYVFMLFKKDETQKSFKTICSLVTRKCTVAVLP